MFSRLLIVAGLAASAVASAGVSFSAQQRPDFSGGWIASKEAPENVTAAPSPVFGPRFWLDHKGDRLTVIRPVRDTAVVAEHTLDGAEVRSRIPGAMCLGDAATVTSVAWEGEAIVHRVLGSVPPGATAVTPLTIRQTFRKIGNDRLVVESLARLPGKPEPVAVATIYTRITDARPAVAAVPTVKLATATLGRLGWLSGTWAGTVGTSTAEERWTPASGGSMLATSRTVGSTGAVTAFEYLCIAERAGSLVYTAMPNGRSPATDFMLTAIDDTSATFENPAHDFPKTIRYALHPDGALDAIVSGAPGQRSITITFRKQ